MAAGDPVFPIGSIGPMGPIGLSASGPDYDRITKEVLARLGIRAGDRLLARRGDDTIELENPLDIDVVEHVLRT